MEYYTYRNVIYLEEYTKHCVFQNSIHKGILQINGTGAYSTTQLQELTEMRQIVYDSPYFDKLCDMYAVFLQECVIGSKLG